MHIFPGNNVLYDNVFRQVICKGCHLTHMLKTLA